MSSALGKLADTVEKALNSLKAGVFNADVKSAVAASKESLKSDTSIDESQKKEVEKATTTAIDALENSSDEDNNENDVNSKHFNFFIAILSMFLQHLQSQQDQSKTQQNQSNAQQKQNTQPSWAIVIVDMAKWFFGEKNSTNMVTEKGDVLQGVLKNNEVLSKHSLQQIPNNHVLNQYFMSQIRDVPAGYRYLYTGSTITRRTKDGSPSPYTAYYTPDGNTRITGNFKEGFKDVLKLYKEAGVDIKHANITGIPLHNADAYEVIKAGVNAGVTPILADKGILGSAALFSQEGAATNPDGYKADTEKYLEQIAGNSAVRAQMVDEMVGAGLGKKPDLDKMDNKALTDKAFEHVLSVKPEAKIEAKPMPDSRLDLETGSPENTGAASASTLHITAKEGDALKEGNILQKMFASEDALTKKDLQYTPDAEGTGGTLTPLLKDGESTPSYSAHFTLGENGGLTATVTGPNFDQGLKDVLQQFRDAGIDTVELSGPDFETSEGAYKAISAAMEADITATLAGKGVLESAKAFADGVAQVNPSNAADNEAATKNYLEKMAGNGELRKKMIDEMAKNEVGKKQELEGLSNKALAEKAFKDEMPKSEAEVKVEAEAVPEDRVDTGPELDTGADLAEEITSSASTAPVPAPSSEPDNRVDTGAELDTEPELDAAEPDNRVDTGAELDTGPELDAAESDLAKGAASLAGGSSPSVSTAPAPKEGARKDIAMISASVHMVDADVEKEAAKAVQSVGAPKPLSGKNPEDEEKGSFGFGKSGS